MKQTMLKLLSVPEELKTEYWQDILQKNRRSLFVVCFMIVAMELFNIARVLFWSKSGLQSVNNRIYFALYCALLASALLYLLLDKRLRHSAVKSRWTLQYGSVAFFLVWHALLNAYDLVRTPYGGINVFVTAVLALAVFIHMPTAFSIATYSGAYALFVYLAHSNMTSGSVVNLTFSTIVALAVSLTDTHNIVMITSQRRALSHANDQLQAMLQKDPLTGLLNKIAFQNCAELAMKNTGYGQTFALLLIDLDDFKSINDNLGHLCGDFVLEQVAEALHAAFPDAAGIGRVGGDEFAVALSGAQAETAEQAGRRLIQALDGVCWRDEPVKACCSVGVCRTKRMKTAYHQLYEHADQALYEAKRRGKGRCHIFEND